MPTREAWIKRRIEYLEIAIKKQQEEVGDLCRELRLIQGKAVNGHQAEAMTLNCAPLCTIYDPLLEGEINA